MDGKDNYKVKIISESSILRNYESENFKTEKLSLVNERPQQSFVFEQSNKNERINKINKYFI